MRPSSSFSSRWRYLARYAIRSESWRHRTRRMVWIVLLVAIVLEGVLIVQPSESGQNMTDPPSATRAAPAARAPMPTVLPAPSAPTTLVPATAAEQAAFKAGQRSCETDPATALAPVVAAAEQAAFMAGHQWCRSLATPGHNGAGGNR